jgi:integrase
MTQGDWTDPALGRITFGEYAEAWLASRADLKPKTRHQYQWLMRQYIMPTWRTVPLAKITFEHLTQWISRLSLSRLGPSGIRQCVFVMSAALDHAVRSGRLRSNPARGLGLPRPKRRDYIYLTHGQVLTLASEAGRGRLLILLLAYTGLFSRGRRLRRKPGLRVCAAQRLME